MAGALESTTRHDERGWVKAECLPGQVLVFRLGGHLSPTIGEATLAFAVRCLARAAPGGAVHAFHDWSDVTSYDARVRLRFTEWLVTHRARFRSVHILFDGRGERAQLVRMGLAVANLALAGFLRVHGAPGSFERALRDAAGGGVDAAPSRGARR
jgi:hypothetical protein